MATSLHRRQLLQALVMMPSALVLAGCLAPPALALGGELPALDALAPAFDLEGVRPDPKGEAQPVQLSGADFAGQWLVLYFYPRDFTSGCTLEARGFQRDLPTYRQAGAMVVGVSADDGESHAAFCGSEGLAFPLLSDPGGKVSRSYGSWIAPYSQRHTFLIDPAGILRARWSGVNPSRHSAEVLEELRRQQSSLPT
ncbi:MAG: peroxiredoxin [Cyanobium sp. ELA507]